jgi:hypothetical protein
LVGLNFPKKLHIKPTTHRHIYIGQCYSIPWVWNIIQYPSQPPTRPHLSGSWRSRPRPHPVRFSRAGDGIRFHRPVFTHTIWWTGLDRASLLFSHSTHVLGFFSFCCCFFHYTQHKGHSLSFFRKQRSFSHLFFMS